MIQNSKWQLLEKINNNDHDAIKTEIEALLKDVKFNNFKNTKDEDGNCKNCCSELICSLCNGCTDCETQDNSYMCEDSYELLIQYDLDDFFCIKQLDEQKKNVPKECLDDLWDLTKTYLVYYYVPFDRACFDCVDKIESKLDEKYKNDNFKKIMFIKDYLKWFDENKEKDSKEISNDIKNLTNLLSNLDKGTQVKKIEKEKER